MLGEFTFGDVHENVGNLEDIVDVGFDAVTPFLDFVLVTCDLMGQESIRRHNLLEMGKQTSYRLPPFLRRTIETFVSLSCQVSIC